MSVAAPARAASAQFDAIVVGSGPGGATVARDLAGKGRRVLLLERGGDTSPRDGLIYLASVGNFMQVAEGAGTARALTTGGTTSLYFGIADTPPLELFRPLGIDLSEALSAAQRELPITCPIPDRLLGAQVRKVAESATQLGLAWNKAKSLLAEESLCKDGFSHGAIWRAKRYVDEAVQRGATLITRATVQKVLVEDGCATGVEYEIKIGRRRELRQAFGRRIVLAAGSLATPQILRGSGIVNVGSRGFYCDPAMIVFGHVDGLKGGDLFPGLMTMAEEDGLLLGDGCLPRSMYRGQMLSTRKFMDLFRHRSHIGVGVMVRDGLGGELRADGGLHKEFTREEKAKLEKGAALAERIVAQAGGKGITRSGLSAAHVGGLLQIGEHIDASLQTELKNLHVVDCSILPVNVRLTPVLTLVCLGKYLAARLEQVL
ncbi:FAD-dependent oxidoreductase [Janthinobacterium sp. FT14W]|uniref:FAD-dependent oxidoreductase n=1 Tax=Janthinobacterium sp. FT14W TaxID=2654253 RepID=UPI00186AF498|nr:FAD-dependent oxidoreductase [Janthinobacterium sp. FT14W]